MDILTKILAWLFSLITAIGVIPKTIPTRVALEKISKEDIMISTEYYDFKYDNGKFSIALNSVTMFADATSEFKLNENTVSSVDYDSFTIETAQISDARGTATKATATLTSDSLPTMKQHFTFYNDTKYFLISTELIAKDGEVASNYIAPVVIKDGNIQNGKPRWTNFLKVPFDNDNWASFETSSLMESALSHEVGAFFTPDDKDGLIIGSVNHDTWKSAVEYKNKVAAIDELYVY